MAKKAITLMADLDAGATGSMCSAMIPDLIKPVITAHHGGDRKKAAALYRNILPLINYENRQCGLAFGQGGDEGRRRDQV